MTKHLNRWGIGGATLALVVAAGCGSGAGTISTGTDQLTLGLSVPDLSESFWVSIAYGVEKEAKKEGVKVVIVNAGGDANADKQISQIQDLTQRKVAAIMIGATNADAVSSSVDAAVAQGIPVIGLSSVPNSDKLASVVGTDNFGMGKIQAECLGTALSGKGSVGALAGPAGQTWAEDRLKGFEQTLEDQFPSIEVAARSHLADNTNTALTTVADWIQRFPELTGVYSATDDLGAGAVNAIAEAKRKGDIKVSSSNLSPTAQQLIRSGDFTCDAIQQIVEQGRQGVIQAVKGARKQPTEKQVTTPVLKITAANIATVDMSSVAAPDGYKP
jgi:TMAO reductase system protein TorT